jgi:murein DD-endopeptidase MepM/ murein hydrolase activator NlpD
VIGKLGSLDALATPASRDTPRSATARDAAAQFEALMLRQLLDELPLGLEGTQAETFSSLVYDALAQQLVEAGGLGLADALEGGIAPTAPRAPHPHVTSAFGLRRDPLDGTRRQHDGVDLDAPAGSTIRSLQPGVVTFAGEARGYGNLVIVDHGEGLETRYAHCDRLDVAVGQRVGGGEALATVGATGRATGPHLHLEVRRDGAPTDPLPWLDRFGPKAIVDPIRGAE